MIDLIIGIIAVAVIALAYAQVAKWDREYNARAERHRRP